MKNLNQIKTLVGNVTEEQLADVDCSVCDKLGVFVPSTGYCKYAITPGHTHPAYMLNIFTTTDQDFVPVEIQVPKGRLLACILAPDIPHVERSGGQFTRYYAVMIEKNFFREIYASYCDDTIPEYFWNQFSVDLDTLFFVRQFLLEYESNKIGSTSILESLAFIIAHRLIRSLLQIEETSIPVSSCYGLSQAEEYMQQNFEQKISLTDMAQLASMSVSHFERTFKTVYGKPPARYLLDLRIQKAKKLLKENQLPITEISYRCGFSSASRFSSCFLKRAGISPSDYKKSFSTHNDKN